MLSAPSGFAQHTGETMNAAISVVASENTAKLPEYSPRNVYANPDDYKTPEARQAWLLRWIFHNPFYSCTEPAMVFAYQRLTGAEVRPVHLNHWTCDQLQEDLLALEEKGHLKCYLEHQHSGVRSAVFELSKEQDSIEMSNFEPMPTTWHIDR
jgi:hypothetical protein